MVTSTVKVTGGTYGRTSVRTSVAVPRRLIGRVMEEIRQVVMAAPVKTGQVIMHDVAGSGADLVITRSVESA